MKRKTILSAERIQHTKTIWTPPQQKINGAHGAENIQHIQHFSRKKRFLEP